MTQGYIQTRTNRNGGSAWRAGWVRCDEASRRPRATCGGIYSRPSLLLLLLRHSIAAQLKHGITAYSGVPAFTASQSGTLPHAPPDVVRQLQLFLEFHTIQVSYPSSHCTSCSAHVIAVCRMVGEGVLVLRARVVRSVWLYCIFSITLEQQRWFHNN